MTARNHSTRPPGRRTPGTTCLSAALGLLLLAAVPTTTRAQAGGGSPPVGATNAPVSIVPAPEAATPNVAAPNVATPNVATPTAATPTAAAPSTAASNAPVAGKFDNTPILRPSPPGAQGAAPTTSQSGSHSGTGPDLFRVALALAAVLGLIFLLRWGSRRLMNVPSASRGSQTIQVLTRTALSPRQHVVLLQVGRRLLIVADGGTQASALGQITDPDEVAAVIGQLRAEKQAGASASFGSLFGRVKGAFTGDPHGAQEEADAAELAGMPPMEGRSYDDPDDGDDTRHNAPRTPQRPNGGLIGTSDIDANDAQEIAATRQELSGLMEKVRNLSKQFGRG